MRKWLLEQVIPTIHTGLYPTRAKGIDVMGADWDTSVFLELCLAPCGNFGGHVTVTGESAPASDPSVATNPILVVGRVVEALEVYDDERGTAQHERLGGPSIAPTQVEAGGPLNQTPAECRASFDRRSVPPETSEAFLADLGPHLEGWLPDEYDFEVSAAFPASPDPEAFATDESAELVQVLGEVSGGEVRFFGGATEASYFAEDALVAVFGPSRLSDEDAES